MTEGSVSVINTATNTVTATVTGLNSPYGVAVTPNGAYAYVTNADSGSVSVISTATNTVTATITGFNDPYGVAVTPNSAYAYVANDGNGTVSVITCASGCECVAFFVDYGCWAVSTVLCYCLVAVQVLTRAISGM